MDEVLKLQNIEKLLQLLVGLMNQQLQTKLSLELLTQKELLHYLNISPNTLKSWETEGLKRLEPPIEGTRSVFYKMSDVITFLTN